MPRPSEPWFGFEDEPVAYHEAGHFVVATFATEPGYPKVRSLTIIPNFERAYQGAMFYVSPLKSYVTSAPTDLGRISDAVMACLAGGLAEQRFTGRACRKGHGPDRELALWLARRVRWSDPPAFLGWLRRRTRTVLDHHWADVEVVAKLVIDKGKVSGREAREAVLAARREREAAIDEYWRDKEPPDDYDYWEEERRREEDDEEEESFEGAYFSSFTVIGFRPCTTSASPSPSSF